MIGCAPSVQTEVQDFIINSSAGQDIHIRLEQSDAVPVNTGIIKSAPSNQLIKV